MDSSTSQDLLHVLGRVALFFCEPGVGKSTDRLHGKVPTGFHACARFHNKHYSTRKCHLGPLRRSSTFWEEGSGQGSRPEACGEIPCHILRRGYRQKEGHRFQG